MPLSWKDRNICLTFHAGKLSQGDFMHLGTAGLVLLDCSSFCCNFLLFFFFFLMGLEQMLQFSVIENMTQRKGFHQEGEQTWGPLLCGGFQAFWSIQVIYGLSRWKPVPVLVTLALWMRMDRKPLRALHDAWQSQQAGHAQSSHCLFLWAELAYKVFPYSILAI